MKFRLTSDGIVNGIINKRFGISGENNLNSIPQISLPLKWQGYPKETKAFAISCIDYDNYQEEGVAWLHWSLANVPLEINKLCENCSIDIKRVDERIVQGKNSWITKLPRDNPECNRYGGPAAILLDHEYVFTIYALDEYLKLDDGFYYNQFITEMQKHVLDKARLIGKYLINK